MKQEEQAKKMQQIITRAWSDEAFKRRLLADATAVLREEGIDLPQGIEVRAVENTDKLFHLVFPSRPSGGELTEDELSAVAGGVVVHHIGCVYWAITKKGTPK